MSTRHVFVTGATGYLGRALVPALQARGHTVRALVRPGSERRLPAGVAFVHGDALDAASYAAHVAPSDTLVQLVGVPHPSPSKAAEFERVDRVSGLAAVAAARAGGVRHLVYVSVAQPAPVMRAYVAVRAAVEAEIRAAVADGLPGATVLRPWYVLGPGHRWAYALRPVYALLRQLPSTRDGAVRLGLVTYADMIAALVHAVEAPATGVRVVDVPAIRGAGKMHKVLV
jgi:nucleoside-diphosphate-sugar epimerase